MVDELTPNNDSEPSGRVLHVCRSPFDSDVVHLVDADTIAAANAAQETAGLVNFGDLRRSGDLTELADRLNGHGEGTVEGYIAAIERSTGRAPASHELGERLAALDGVTFDGECNEGDEDLHYPADDVEFRSEWEVDDQPDPEFWGYNVIAKAMRNDVPEDIFDKYCVESYGNSPAFSELIDSHVKAGRLDDMITALQARGFVIIRE